MALMMLVALPELRDPVALAMVIALMNCSATSV